MRRKMINLEYLFLVLVYCGEEGKEEDRLYSAAVCRVWSCQVGVRLGSIQGAPVGVVGEKTRPQERG